MMNCRRIYAELKSDSNPQCSLSISRKKQRILQRTNIRELQNKFANETNNFNSSVSAMLADLNWQSLEERRIINDLTMFYKINFNVVNISFPAEINLGFQETRRSQDYKFMPLSSSVNAYKYSFFPRAILVWNGLPFLVIHASSVNHFKAGIVLN